MAVLPIFRCHLGCHTHAHTHTFTFTKIKFALNNIRFDNLKFRHSYVRQWQSMVSISRSKISRKSCWIEASIYHSEVRNCQIQVSTGYYCDTFLKENRFWCFVSFSWIKKECHQSTSSLPIDGYIILGRTVLSKLHLWKEPLLKGCCLAGNSDCS